MRRALKLIMLLFLSIYSYSALASCVVTNHGTINFSLPDLIVSHNAAVGSLITQVEQNSVVGTTGSCTGTSYAKYLKGSSTGLKKGVNDVYSTNIPGVGFAICFKSCDTNAYWSPFVTNAENRGNMSGLDFRGEWYFNLIVTGPVSAGVLETGEYSDSGMTSDKEYSVAKVAIISGSIKNLECSLDSTDIQIPFGDIPVDSFKSVGSVSQTKSFNVGLICNSAANINVSLNGEKYSQATNSSILALSSTEGTADGIGVQILYNNEPMIIGSNLSLGRVAENTKETLAFSARYYQTKDVVTPGNAASTATLNITYQ